MDIPKKITVFLPISVFRELAKVCHVEVRTQSEVITIALRSYLDQRRSGVIPTEVELFQVNQERIAFRRGSSQGLKRLVDELHFPTKLDGAKAILRAAAKRSGVDPK